MADLKTEVEIYVDKELKKEVKKLQEENKRYKEALQFYADDNNYDANEYGHDAIIDDYPVMADNGEKARKAIEAK